MIITRTPFRISFAGGGSDLREYYREHGGSVVNATIDKYMFLSMHPYFQDSNTFLKYSKSELVSSTAEIQHPIIREVFDELEVSGVDFGSSADVPAGTGLGSSSTFTVGLINLCCAHLGRYMPKGEIAERACRVEIDKLGEPIGKQDQYAAAFGGLNYIRFHEDEQVTVERIPVSQEALRTLEANLLMFYLGGTRSTRTILNEQRRNTSQSQAAVDNLKRMVGLSEDLRAELARNNVECMGDILKTGWEYKRELASTITGGRIDHYYDLAIRNGARGGKLLGAGGGGFLLLYVEEQQQPRLRKALSDLEELDFRFEQAGTTIVYNS